MNIARVLIVICKLIMKIPRLLEDHQNEKRTDSKDEAA